jgi:hypothetical protein
MRNQQIRLQTPEQIQHGLDGLKGKKINIVTRKNEVYFGTYVSHTEHLLTIQNLRLKKISVAMESVYEITVDTFA